MIGAIRLLIGSGGTDVAELPFFIGSTYTGAWTPYNIRKIGTGKYAYITKWQAGPTGNIGDYEHVQTVWWSPDGIMPVQTPFFNYPGNKGYISHLKTFGGYQFSQLFQAPNSNGPEEPTDRFLSEGFPGADELGSSGLSTNVCQGYSQPNPSNGANGVSSSRGGSGYAVYSMHENDEHAIDTARFGFDYSSSRYRVQLFYNTSNGTQYAYIGKDNSSGTQQWAKEFGTSSSEPSKIWNIIPLSNGKTLLTMSQEDEYMMLNSDGSTQYNYRNGDFCTSDNEVAIDSSETYAYAVKSGDQSLYRMTLATGAVDQLSIKSAQSVPEDNMQNSASDFKSQMMGWDSDGYLWFISYKYGANRVDVSNASSPQIVGTYKTRGFQQYDYVNPHAGLVDGDRVIIFTTGYDNSTYDAYGGFLYCLKTDFSTTTLGIDGSYMANNRYGLTEQSGDGGFGYVQAYTTARTGSWNSQTVTSVTSFSVVDRSSYDWSTNYNNYKSLITTQSNRRPQNGPLS